MIYLKSVYFYFLALIINLKTFIKTSYFSTNSYTKSLRTSVPKEFFFFPSSYLLSPFTNFQNYSFNLSNIDYENFWKQTINKKNLRLHDFLWLGLVDRKTEASLVRKIISRWISNNNSYKKQIWSNSSISRRVISWILNADIILGSTNITFKNDFIESIIIQINHLKKNFNLESNNVTKIEILTTIYLSGLVFHDYKENITFAEKELRKVINIFFDNNGFPKSQNPDDLLQISKYFIILKDCSEAAEHYEIDYIDNLLKNNLMCLRRITTPLNTLPLFNGATEVNLNRFYDFLNEKNYNPKKKNGNVGGLNIINFKKDIVYINSNSPPSKNFSNCYQSGPLSFEYFNDEDKIITNCGFGKNISNKAIFLSKLTSAQSTICIDNTSVVRFERNKVINKAFGSSYEKGFKVFNEKNENNEEETKFYASHDAYLKKFGYICSREIKILKKDHKITGRDFFEKKRETKKVGFSIRFHLTPGLNAVKTISGNSALIQIRKNKSLIFTTDKKNITIEKSVFFAGNKVLNNFCIVISDLLENNDKIINWEIIKKI